MAVNPHEWNWVIDRCLQKTKDKKSTGEFVFFS